MYFLSTLYRFIEYQNNEYHKMIKLNKKEYVKKSKYPLNGYRCFNRYT